MMYEVWFYTPYTRARKIVESSSSQAVKNWATECLVDFIYEETEELEYELCSSQEDVDLYESEEFLQCENESDFEIKPFPESEYEEGLDPPIIKL